MTKKTIWYACLGLLCSAAMALVVYAAANPGRPVMVSARGDAVTSAAKAPNPSQLKAQVSGQQTAIVSPKQSAIANMPQKSEVKALPARHTNIAAERAADPNYVIVKQLLVRYRNGENLSQAEMDLLLQYVPNPTRRPRDDGRRPLDQGGEDCASATVIAGIPHSSVGTTAGFADNYDEVCPYTGSTSPDVAYSYTPAVDISVDISLCVNSAYDTKVYVYEGACPGTLVACNDDFCSSPLFSSYVSFLGCVDLLAGNTYYIIVDGYFGDFGDYTLDITECLPCGEPPANDICENAVVAVLPFSGTGDNTCAEEECASLSGGFYNDVWYTFTTTEVCNVVIDFCGTTDPDFTQNSYIVLSTVCGGGQCTPFVFANTWNWATCGDGNITLYWNSLPPGTYWYPVLGQTNVIEGAFTINITCTPPPPCLTDFVLAAPGSVSGNTIGAGDDCQLRFGDDQVVEVTIPSNGVWTFSICSATDNWDSYMYVSTACCAGVLAQDDDACPEFGVGYSLIECLNLTAGTYYVAIEGFSGNTGPWTLTVSPCVAGQCCYGCPASPTCADLTASQCANLGGIFDGTTTCAQTPCVATCTPPANDLCANATVVTLPFSGTGDNTCACEECQDLSFGSYGDVWYSFTTTETCDLTIDLCGTAPAFGNVYIVLTQAGCCSPFTFYSTFTTCADGNYSINWNGLPAGTWYYPVLRSAAFNAEGPFTINITCEVCLPAPHHDACENAEVATLPYTDTDDNSCAVENCPFLSGGFYNEVWYTFTLTEQCDIIIDLCGTSPVFQTAYIVLVPDCPCTGNWVFTTSYDFTTCSDGNFTGFWDALPPGQYWYPVLGQNGVIEGPYTIHIECDVCEVPEDVTAYRYPGTGNDVNVRYYAPDGGRYKVWSTIVKNNDGDPNNGADPDWTLEATQVVGAPGNQLFVHVGAVTSQAYRNYVVQQDCAPTGRCCYGAEFATCAENASQAECDVLSGIWIEGAVCPCPPPPPHHDACENAEVIASFPYIDSDDNSSATVDCPAGGYRDAWYTFTTTDPCDLSIVYCGTSPAFGNVYIVLATDCPCSGNWTFASNWENSSCGDGNWSVYWNSLPPGTYWAPILTDVGSEGPYTVTFTCSAPPPPPANDNCADAIEVFNGIAVNGSNVGTTTDAAWACAAGGSDMWYFYTATANGTVTVDLCGSSYDTAIQVQSTCGGASLACNDDFCGLQSTTTFAATNGTTYRLAVGGFASQTGNWTMTVSQ